MSNEVLIKRCEICQKDIKAYGSLVRRETKRFCSRICRGVAQTLAGVEIRACKQCGLPFEVSGSRKTKGFGKYCTAYCMAVSYRTPNYIPYTESQRIRRSEAYKHWRTTVYSRDDFTCQLCGIKGGKLHADHVKPFALFPDLRLEISNGRTLCKACHLKTPTYGGRTHKL